MVMSPQQMHQTSQCLADQCSRSLPPSPSYSSQQQNSSYTCSERLSEVGPHLPTQQLLVRQQTWIAPQTSSWAGQAPNHAFSGAGAHRDLTWDSFNHGSVQPWLSTDHFQQVALRGHTAYPQPLYPATAEQLHSYDQAESSLATRNSSYYTYPDMSQGDSGTANFALCNSSNDSGPLARDLTSYRGQHFDALSAPPAGGQTMPAASTAVMTASSPAVQDGVERMQLPATPASHFSDESSTDHYPEPASASLGPSGPQNTSASSDPTEPSNQAETPYAQLIYQALMSRPRHAMRLQEIYQWFLENTNKGQDGTRGWQNSIRHNLSMNGVCSSLFLC